MENSFFCNLMLCKYIVFLSEKLSKCIYRQAESRKECGKITSRDRSTAIWNIQPVQETLPSLWRRNLIGWLICLLWLIGCESSGRLWVLTLKFDTLATMSPESWKWLAPIQMRQVKRYWSTISTMTMVQSYPSPLHYHMSPDKDLHLFWWGHLLTRTSSEVPNQFWGTKPQGQCCRIVFPFFKSRNQ